MRTDAKIGFAIGGVLLAVLTVYAIVVPKHKKTTANTVTLVTPVAPAASSAQTMDGSPVTPPMTAAGDAASLTKEPEPAPVAPAPAPAAAPPITANTGPASDDGIFHPAKPMEMTKADDQKPTIDQAPLADTLSQTSKSLRGSNHSAAKPAPADDAVGSADEHPYVIKSGQTLSSIAAEVYGNSRFWVAIQRENKGLDANHLKVGSKIILPDITPLRPGPIATVADDVEAPTATITQAAKSDGHSYTVKPGDTLYGISKRLFGTGRKADALYALNKAEIGADKSRLKLGMVLKLPENPALALAAH